MFTEIVLVPDVQWVRPFAVKKADHIKRLEKRTADIMSIGYMRSQE